MQPLNGSYSSAQLISDRYQVLAFLGGGEATEVYKVKDIVAGQVLALKVLRDDVPREAELRLSREFYYLSRFNHPGIVSAIDYGSTPERRPFFTMEFFDGRPLHSFFGGRYAPGVVDVAVQVLRALDSIHAQGLIHCDLKPANILVREADGRLEAKLLDFGFAEKASLAGATVPRGTLGYVAPEVWKGIDADARADLYSLGLVLYETVTGCGPGSEKNLREWLRLQYHADFAGLRTFDPAIPAEFEAVVMSLVRREPERRPRSAAAVIAALTGRPEEPIAATAGPRRYLMAPGFVGRSEQLNGLRKLLEAAGQGKAGAACISGERGVGKSRLLAEFRFLAQLEGATILSFEPVSLGARPQSLIETVLSYLRVYSGPALPAGLDSRGAVSEEGKYRLFETVTQRLRELAASHRVEHSLVILVDDFELFDPTSLEFLRYLVFSLESDRMMVICAGLKEKRFIDLIAEFERKSSFAHLPMPPMAGADIGGLVESLLGELGDAGVLVDWLQGITGGNPLFVIETIYSLIEAKILAGRAGRWVLATEALAAYRPPESVTDVVKRRLDGLSTEETEILRVGAAAAGPFALEFLRAVTGYDEKVLFNAIGRLKALGLLRHFAEGTLILSSKILEAAVTERLSVAERRENHRRVALALELLYPEKQDQLVFDLAHHYTQAAIPDRAYACSLRAGARAREFQLSEQALSFYETALSLSTQAAGPRERVELIETVGELREATGKYPEALDIYTQGMGIIVADPDLGREKRLLARFLRRLGLVHQKQARHDEALNYFHQALSMRGDRQSVDHIHILNDLGWSYSATGKLDRAEELLTQALQLAERRRGQDPGESDAIIARTLYIFSVLSWARYDFVLALQLAERSLGIYETLHDDHYTGKVSQFIATLWWRRGETGRAREYYQRYLPAQRKSGDVYFLLRSLSGLGIISQDEGDWDRAYDCFAEALSLAERIGDRPATVELLSNIGTAADERGDWPAALDCYRRALALHAAAAVQNQNDLAAVQANLASLRTRQGGLDEADRLLGEAEKIVATSPDFALRANVALYRCQQQLAAEKNAPAGRALVEALRCARRERQPRLLAAVHRTAAEYRLATGDPARAAASAAKAMQLGKDRPDSREHAIALRWAGLAASGQGRPDRGAPELRRSAEILRAAGATYELALTLLAQARALGGQDRAETTDRKPPVALRPVPQPDLAEAIAGLKEALAIFRRLGAEPDARRADELLATYGQLAATMQLKARERGEYLKVFYQLSELIGQDLDADDFAERILDLIIDVTHAERGLLLLLQGDTLRPAAARNLDATTLQDAESISHTVLRKTRRRGELIFSADALSDPRFNSANSVVLNKIRSMLCVPLLADNRVIGTVYLDSRITAHLFLEEDKNLLTSVANLLAATIDRSAAFRRIQEEASLAGEGAIVDPVTGIFLGRARAMREVYAVIDRIAATPCTVLLTGETGTGKGVLARLIHSKSDRSGNKFVPINCGAMPETLFESELFGHARGSFTGAVKDKEGLLETAEGGTIFLDEIANTSPAIQAKLLQVLEDRVIRRVGETQVRHVDVRLIAATNRDLEHEAEQARFRQDLYYRLNVVTIHVPALRDRATDIPLLAAYFLKHYANQLNKPIHGFEETVLQTLTDYQWPGNARELMNTIERAAIMTQTRRIAPQDLPDHLRNLQPPPPSTRRRLLDREQVLCALRDSRGNISRAAQLLSTHRRQFQRLMKRYRIDRNNLS